jgi:hypothetical protein
VQKFPDIKVGDAIGIRSNDHNRLRYYRYEYAVVTETNETSFRTRFGWFSKETGRRGSDEAVTVAEREENNRRWYAQQACLRRQKAIKWMLADLGASPEDAEVLRQVEQLLQDRLAAAAAKRQKEEQEEAACDVGRATVEAG